MARSGGVDPLEKFRFRVEWSNSGADESTPLARIGFHDIQMPKRSTNKIAYREGEDPDISMQSPGISTMEDIVLSRGLLVAGDNGADGNEMYKWMSAVHNPTAGLSPRNTLGPRSATAASNNYRKDITITMLDREGKAVRGWVLHQAFPVSFVPGSDLNAGEDGEKSLEQLTLAYEDFQEVPAAASGELIAGEIATASAVYGS